MRSPHTHMWARGIQIAALLTVSGSTQEDRQMQKKWPKLLRLLSEDLGYTIRAGKPVLGYDIFFVDPSSWKLRLSNRTPVIWVKSSDVQAGPPQHLLQSLGDVMREQNLTRRIVLVLLDADSRPLLRHTASPLYNLVVIGAE